MVNIGIVGFGTVGSGVFEVIDKNRKSIAKRAGAEIRVKRICDRKDFEDEAVAGLITRDFKDLIEDEEISVIVETMGGTTPAYDFVKSALLAGKSVCTSNKELVAKYGTELIEIAKENRVSFMFEASVGGGIPIIRPINQALTADKIMEIKGILNGTTNYILTKMAREGADYHSALKEAQDLGYAERNPEADVEGYDSCRKIAILTSLAYGKQVDYEDIYTEGITKITKEDMDYAKALDASVKLIGESRRENGVVYARVAPALISAIHPLYSVNDVFNAIFVKGNMLGDAMFYGRGAGKLPTASAVVADVIDAVKHAGSHIVTIWSNEKLELGDIKNARQRFFVRVKSEDKQKATELFGEIEEVRSERVKGEFAFITKEVSEEEFQTKAEEIELINRIRIAF